MLSFFVGFLNAICVIDYYSELKCFDPLKIGSTIAYSTSRFKSSVRASGSILQKMVSITLVLDQP